MRFIAKYMPVKAKLAQIPNHLTQRDNLNPANLKFDGMHVKMYIS
jgi:hypothetical protein